jgi:hypothetical protein
MGDWDEPGKEEERESHELGDEKDAAERLRVYFAMLYMFAWPKNKAQASAFAPYEFGPYILISYCCVPLQAQRSLILSSSHDAIALVMQFQ